MNEEARKKLEEMAKDQIGVYDSNTRAAFIIGAQAAWDLATQGSQIIMGEFTATSNVLPVSEDMKRWEKNTFLAVLPGLREAVAFAVEEERKRCAAIVSTFKHEDINAEARLTLARIQTSIIRPSKEGA